MAVVGKVVRQWQRLLWRMVIVEEEEVEHIDGTKSSVGVCQGSFGKVKQRWYYIEQVLHIL